MKKTTTSRILGFSLIGAGIVVAVIGWFGVSGETEVAFQLPFFASAAVGALLLFGAGATVLIRERMEIDAVRLDDMETAIRQLATEFAAVTDAIVSMREDYAPAVRAAGGDEIARARTRRRTR